MWNDFKVIRLVGMLLVWLIVLIENLNEMVFWIIKLCFWKKKSNKLMFGCIIFGFLDIDMKM